MWVSFFTIGGVHIKLYEATNGYMGCSYVRCLVWASNETEAVELAMKSYKEDGEGRHDESYWNDIELRLILDTEMNKGTFYTEPTD